MSANETQAIIGKPSIVTLVLRTRYPKTRRPMYCINCGGILQFTYKDVRLIIQGVAEIQEISDEVQCRKCKAVYEIC